MQLKQIPLKRLWWNTRVNVFILGERQVSNIKRKLFLWLELRLGSGVKRHTGCCCGVLPKTQPVFVTGKRWMVTAAQIWTINAVLIEWYWKNWWDINDIIKNTQTRYISHTEGAFLSRRRCLLVYVVCSLMISRTFDECTSLLMFMAAFYSVQNSFVFFSYYFCAITC